jgi:hypothetical protein
MKELGTMICSLMEDRNQLKWKVNVIKDNRVMGFIKPVKC